jgi:hypothetical protein
MAHHAPPMLQAEAVAGAGARASPEAKHQDWCDNNIQQDLDTDTVMPRCTTTPCGIQCRSCYMPAAAGTSPGEARLDPRRSRTAGALDTRGRCRLRSRAPHGRIQRQPMHCGGLQCCMQSAAVICVSGRLIPGCSASILRTHHAALHCKAVALMLVRATRMPGGGAAQHHALQRPAALAAQRADHPKLSAPTPARQNQRGRNGCWSAELQLPAHAHTWARCPSGVCPCAAGAARWGRADTMAGIGRWIQWDAYTVTACRQVLMHAQPVAAAEAGCVLKTGSKGNKHMLNEQGQLPDAAVGSCPMRAAPFPPPESCSFDPPTGTSSWVSTWASIRASIWARHLQIRVLETKNGISRSPMVRNQ